jgi:hypothetical protein
MTHEREVDWMDWEYLLLLQEVSRNGLLWNYSLSCLGWCLIVSFTELLIRIHNNKQNDDSKMNMEQEVRKTHTIFDNQRNYSIDLKNRSVYDDLME